jgi:hypothetical protein
MLFQWLRGGGEAKILALGSAQSGQRYVIEKSKAHTFPLRKLCERFFTLQRANLALRSFADFDFV